MATIDLAVANDHELDIKSTMMYRHDDYVDEYDTRENYNFEVHRKYIDVHLMVDGEEEIFYAPLSHGSENVAYDEEKDVSV